MSFLKSLKGLADDFKDMISDKDDQKKKDEKLPAQSEGTFSSNPFKVRQLDSHYQTPLGASHDLLLHSDV